MITPTHPIESQPLGDAPEFPPVRDIDGMEPYERFSKRIPRDFFERWKDPILVILDNHDRPFISWNMAQIVVSVLHDLPTALEYKDDRNWVLKHFQLCEESTHEDPDHIVLPTNSSVLCYRHESGTEYVPIRRLDAIGRLCYAAHNDAGHDYSKKEYTLVIVGSFRLQQYPFADFARFCPTCIKTAKADHDRRVRSNPKPTAIVWSGETRGEQQERMLSVEKDGADNSVLYTQNKAVYWGLSESIVPVSRQSCARDSSASDEASEATIPGMAIDEDDCFGMASLNILDEDDDVPVSQAVLELKTAGMRGEMTSA